MSERPGNDQLLWQAQIDRLRHELSGLDAEEGVWLAAALARVAEIQQSLHDCFLAAGGPAICSDCAGECCGCGKNHLTLVNLLAYLHPGEPLPEPDFARPCPFLGPAGCRHEVSRRPFNCVTFLCEAVEARLGAAGRERFYALERDLRTLYEAFDRRYAGSSLRGIFIRSERLGERPLLGRP